MLSRLRVVALVAAVLISACATTAAEPPYKWTRFVSVDGQPDPVPVEWVSTPEGKFAHSIKIPNPVPKDSGYKPGMSSEEYFEHLCKTEAGEFIFKTVDNVEGFYFMRPPKRPTDDELKDRYALEAPEIERFYQLLRPNPAERAKVFVNPPWALFKEIEEPLSDAGQFHMRSSRYSQKKTPMTTEVVANRESRYGLVWRGLKRPNDRELAISGGEWIVINLQTNEILAVMRSYGRTGGTRGTPGGIWWLNAVQCKNFKKITSAADKGQQLYDFVSSVLRPVSGENK
jgi:hypothetical protein